MYSRILIPIDGSRCSELALHEGLALAKRLGAEVRFLYVVEDPASSAYIQPSVAYYPELYDSLKQAAEATLERAKVLAADAGVPATTHMVEHRRPVEGIHEAEKDADLVVMGTHGRRGFDRIIFGSVAEGALRRGTKPYLMVRASEDDSQEPRQVGG